MSIRNGSRHLNGLAVVLVFVTLLGSVLIPARLTWRIVGQLDAIAAIDPDVALAINRVRAFEETSLIVNAGLVLVALAAVASVIALTRRERQLARERAGLLEEAREGRRQLERAMQGRNRLMRGFSHDVKNPLGAADGYAELLALEIQGALTPQQRETIQRIRRCIRTALDLIENLHELGRAETANVVLVTTCFDLSELLRTIAEDHQGAARARGLALTVDLPAEPIAVETDRARVREIIANLLSNAVKYTTSGAVTVRLVVGQSVEDRPGEIRIDVIDTGPGIPAEKHDMIFEEFTPLGTEPGGAGLGLAISKLLAEALGGRLSLESRSGSGSTFSLWLPCDNGVHGDESARPPSALAPRVVSSRPTTWRDERASVPRGRA